MWLHNEVTGEVIVKALVDTSNIEAALKLYDIKGKVRQPVTIMLQQITKS